MKIKEMRDLNAEDLKEKERNFVEGLFKLRFRHAAGHLDSSSALKQARKDIARVKTVLREKEDSK